LSVSHAFRVSDGCNNQITQYAHGLSVLSAQRPKLSDGGHGRADGNRDAMPPFAAAHGLTAFSLEQNRPIAANSLITKRNQCLEYTLAINIVKAIVETLCTAPKLCCVLERAATF